MLTIDQIKTTAEAVCAASYPGHEVEVKPTASGVWLVVKKGKQQRVMICAPEDEAGVERRVRSLAATILPDDEGLE
jgi:hypothetical protein